MIDVENKVFNDVATALRSTFSGISVYGEYVETPTSFPSVSIVEEDNFASAEFIPIKRTTEEEYADIMYTVNVYSNKASGKKSEAKSIADKVDELMRGFGFNRQMRTQMPNLDRTIYRMTLRYVGRVKALPNDKYVIYGR